MVRNCATCANGDIHYSPWPVIRVRIEERRGLDLDEVGPKPGGRPTVGAGYRGRETPSSDGVAYRTVG